MYDKIRGKPSTSLTLNAFNQTPWSKSTIHRLGSKVKGLDKGKWAQYRVPDLSY